MLNLQKIKLLIFDMDGTLIDSAKLNYYSYHKALKEFDIELDEDFYYNKCFGLHYSEFIRNILNIQNKLNINDSENNKLIESIHNKKEEIYLNNLDMITLHPFVVDTLFNNNKYKALATTASQNGVYGILKEFNLQNCFDLIITGDDIKNKKPNPEIFFTCMKHFNSSAKETIIFEDSKVGLEAANNSNAWVIKIEKWA